MTMVDRRRFRSLLEADVEATCPDGIRVAASEIASRHGPTVAAVLFYGSSLRHPDPDGIADLYVLVDSYRDFHGGPAAAIANRLLPPTVMFLPGRGSGHAGFKVAVIALSQFRNRMRPNAVDTTLWARFCQPAVLAYCRDGAARDHVLDALAEATVTAVHWAVRLGPGQGRGADLWRALFRATYGAELRVESHDRSETLVARAEDRYAALLPLAAAENELEPVGNGLYRRLLPATDVAVARKRWRRGRHLGKGLNLCRLAKALFTFENGVDYIVWKLERHSGQTITLTPWQRRHPLLAAPPTIIGLYRRGVIR